MNTLLQKAIQYSLVVAVALISIAAFTLAMLILISPEFGSRFNDSYLAPEEYDN